MLAVLLAALAGRLLEQMVGVARVSDLTLFWILLGTFAALPVVMGHRPATAPPAPSSGRRCRSDRTVSRAKGGETLGLRPLLLGIGVAGLIVGIGVLTWTKSINYFRAGVIVDQAAQQFRDGRLQTSMASLDRAIDLAPDVSTYYNNRNTAYWACRESSPTQPVSTVSSTTDPKIIDLCGPEEQRAQNQQWVEKRPFDFRSRLALADSFRDLGLLDSDPELIEESIRLYQEAAEMVENGWPVWNRVSEVYLEAGKPESALEPLDKSLQITGNSEPAYDALLIQARAYHTLGQLNVAIDSSGPHHQDSGEAKIRESTAGVSRKPSSDCKACGCSSKHLCGLTAWNT